MLSAIEQEIIEVLSGKRQPREWDDELSKAILVMSYKGLVEIIYLPDGRKSATITEKGRAALEGGGK